MEALVGGEGEQVAALLAVGPLGQVQVVVPVPAVFALGLGVGDRDVQGEQQVEEVGVLDADPQARFPFGPGEFGAQLLGAPLHEVEEERERGAPAPAGVAGGVEALQPACRAVGAALLGGQVPVDEAGGGAGLLQDLQPQGGELAAVTAGRGQSEERAADGGNATGERHEGAAVCLPPAERGAQGGGQGQQFGEVVLLGFGAGQARGAGEAAQFGGGLGGGRQPAGGAAYAQAAEALVGFGGGDAAGQGLAVAGEHLHRQGADEGEFEEDGVEAVLVDAQPVLGLGVTGPPEQLGGVGGVLDGEEEARGLLVEEGQEVRDGRGEAAGQFEAGVEGGLGLGLGLPGDPVQFGDDGEGVVAVLGVVHEDPFGEAEGLAPAQADDGRLALVPYESQEPGGEVLGRAQFAGSEPDDDAVVAEAGVVVGARGQLHDVAAGAGGVPRQYRTGLEQQFGVVHLGVFLVGAHASPPSSILRPA